MALRAPGYEPAEFRKTRQIEGPISHVKVTPFAIVAGTAAKDPRMRRFVRRQAEYEKRGWKDWQRVEPRYFLDTEITDKQIRKYSLLLIGGPEENLVTRKLIRQIPLAIGPDSVTIDGQKIVAPDAGVAMVYPHPLNPDRYVCVKAATSPDGMFLVGETPGDVDFAVVDGCIEVERRGPQSEKLYAASGYFDRHWRYREELVVRGDPALREKAVRLKVPKYLTAAVPGKRLMLSDLLETRASGFFRDMRRDVNWQREPITLGGKTYARGIAVKGWAEARSFAVYDLTGGNWRRLRAVVGIEVDEPEKIREWAKKNTGLAFHVRGDGRELYRSPVFTTDAPPVELDVDISNVKELEIEVTNEHKAWTAEKSVNWADIRLEK